MLKLRPRERIDYDELTRTIFTRSEQEYGAEILNAYGDDNFISE